MSPPSKKVGGSVPHQIAPIITMTAYLPVSSEISVFKTCAHAQINVIQT